VAIEQVIRVVFDDNAYTRNVAQAAAVSGRFDATVGSLTSSLAAMAAGANRAGAAQALAATSGGAFLAALQKQVTALTQQSGVIGKSEADLLRLKAAELGVATQADATIAALERQNAAIQKLAAGGRAVQSIGSINVQERTALGEGLAVDARSGRAAQASAQAAIEADRERLQSLARLAAAEADYRRAIESGIAVDLKAGRAKQDLIAQIERETAALQQAAGARTAAVGQPGGALVDRVQAVAAQDPEFAARAQPALINLGAAQAARDQQLFIASLERTANAAGRTRAELLALEAAERGVSAQAAPLIARIASVDRQFQSFSKTGRLTALELRQVGFQLNDFGVQLASGGNPFVALIQQGSQLSGTFGGVGNAVRALLSLLTPVKLAIGGLGAAVGVFALGASKSEDWARSLTTLEAALEATGRAGVVTSAQLSKAIDELAKAPGITRDAAIESVTALARAGQVNGSLLTDIARSVPDFARAVGKDAPEATRQLVQALSEPLQGAKSLEEALPRLSSATRLVIRDLVNQGDVLGAQRTLLTEVARVTQGLADKQTPLQKATNDLGNSWDTLQKALRDSTGAELAVKGLTGIVGAIDQVLRKAEELRQGKIQIPALSFLGAGANPLFNAVALGLQGEPAQPPGAAQRRASGRVTDGAGRPLTPAEVSAAAIPAAAQTAKAIEDQVKAALKLGESYTSTSQRIDELVTKQRTLRTALSAASTAYGANSEQAKALRSQIAGIGEAIEAAQKKGGDPDRELKRRTAADIEQARRSAQAQTAVIAQQNEELRGQYDEGLIDVATFYQRREELAAQAAKVQQDRIAAEEAAQRERLGGRATETRAAAADALETFPDQRTKAIAEAEQASAKLTKDERRERLQIDRQIADIDAEIAQLSGDEAAAETIRNQQRIEQVRILASQRFVNEDKSQVDARVQSVTRLLQQQSQLNQLQRDSSLLVERVAIAEESYGIAAERRGDTRVQIEDALYARRQQMLPQLAAMAEQARQLAAASSDPRMLVFAEQLALQWQRVADEIEPALQRMRAAGDEVADALGSFAGSLSSDFRNARDHVDALGKSLLRISTAELVEKPLSDEFRKLIRGATEGDGGLGEFARKIFNVGSSGGASTQPATGGFSLGSIFGGGGITDTITGFGGGTLSDAIRRGDFGGAAGGGALGGILGSLGVPARAPSTTPVEAATRATSALDELARAASGAAQALGGGGGGTTSSTGGTFSGIGAIFDTSGAGTVDKPSAERDILRRIEAGITEEVVAPFGEAIEVVVPKLDDLALSTEGVGGAFSLLPGAFDQLFSSLQASFSGGGDSGGGVIGSITKLFGSFFGGGSSDYGFTDLGFDGGGFTGPGGKFEPAGIVHKGEHVMPMERVAEPGALQFLETVRERGFLRALSSVRAFASLRGFAEGGPVVAAATAAAPASTAAAPVAAAPSSSIAAVLAGAAVGLSPSPALAAVETAASSPVSGSSALLAAPVTGGIHESSSLIERIAASAHDSRTQIIVGGVLHEALAREGYTGPGAKFEVAGVVHRGEHVQPQERVREPGALRFLETMRESGFEHALRESTTERLLPFERALRVGGASMSVLPGYAGGGLVGGGSSSFEPALERLRDPDSGQRGDTFVDMRGLTVDSRGAMDRASEERAAQRIAHRAQAFMSRHSA
jgi:hypothetical protein